MTLQEYKSALEKKLAFYGFTSNPLTSNQALALWHDDIDLDSAYEIACDVNCGYCFARAYGAQL